MQSLNSLWYRSHPASNKCWPLWNKLYLNCTLRVDEFNLLLHLPLVGWCLLSWQCETCVVCHCLHRWCTSFPYRPHPDQRWTRWCQLSSRHEWPEANLWQTERRAKENIKMRCEKCVGCIFFFGMWEYDLKRLKNAALCQSTKSAQSQVINPAVCKSEGTNWEMIRNDEQTGLDLSDGLYVCVQRLWITFTLACQDILMWALPGRETMGYMWTHTNREENTSHTLSFTSPIRCFLRGGDLLKLYC